MQLCAGLAAPAACLGANCATTPISTLHLHPINTLIHNPQQVLKVSTALLHHCCCCFTRLRLAAAAIAAATAIAAAAASVCHCIQHPCLNQWVDYLWCLILWAVANTWQLNKLCKQQTHSTISHIRRGRLVQTLANALYRTCTQAQQQTVHASTAHTCTRQPRLYPRMAAGSSTCCVPIRSVSREVGRQRQQHLGGTVRYCSL